MAIKQYAKITERAKNRNRKERKTYSRKAAGLKDCFQIVSESLLHMELARLDDRAVVRRILGRLQLHLGAAFSNNR